MTELVAHLRVIEETPAYWRVVYTRHENLRDSSKVRRLKDVDLERQPTYNLRDSELLLIAPNIP